jgi:hypothetical protein
LFLNSLQINYPTWLETIDPRGGREKTVPVGGIEDEKIISCKYSGDYLESLSLSHWLAQENNIDFHWEEVLCPDFKGREFASGTFAKICNELQFLKFLANKADYQGVKPIDYDLAPYVDTFSERQHKYGPFMPIIQYHKAKNLKVIF